MSSSIKGVLSAANNSATGDVAWSNPTYAQTEDGNSSHDLYIDVLALYNREVDLDALEDKLNHHWGPWR